MVSWALQEVLGLVTLVVPLRVAWQREPEIGCTDPG